MSHSSDLRVRVLRYIEAGGLIKAACDTFQDYKPFFSRNK